MDAGTLEESLLALAKSKKTSCYSDVFSSSDSDDDPDILVEDTDSEMNGSRSITADGTNDRRLIIEDSYCEADGEAELTVPVKNVFDCRSDFYNIKQNDNETIHKYYQRIRKAIGPCEFAAWQVENIVKDKFVSGLLPGPIKDRIYMEDPAESMNVLLCLASGSSTNYLAKVSTGAYSANFNARLNIKNGRYLLLPNGKKMIRVSSEVLDSAYSEIVDDAIYGKLNVKKRKRNIGHSGSCSSTSSSTSSSDHSSNSKKRKRIIVPESDDEEMSQEFKKLKIIECI